MPACLVLDDHWLTCWQVPAEPGVTAAVVAYHKFCAGWNLTVGLEIDLTLDGRIRNQFPWLSLLLKWSLNELMNFFSLLVGSQTQIGSWPSNIICTLSIANHAFPSRRWGTTCLIVTSSLCAICETKLNGLGNVRCQYHDIKYFRSIASQYLNHYVLPGF